MKLSGCIGLTLIFCTVNFSTSVSDLKSEIGGFSRTGSWKDRNRKSKRISSESSRVFVMRVLSSFFDFSILVAARIIFVRVYPYYIHIIWTIYCYMGDKFFQKCLAPPLFEISKKQDSTYRTEFYSLFIQHIFGRDNNFS